MAYSKNDLPTDIYRRPDIRKHNAEELTIGDLHGNAMFFMHFLVSNGIVKISEYEYNYLSYIYREEATELIKEDIQKFDEIIDNLEIDPKVLIRLLGDEICDRGQNDYFTFKILEKLKKSGVKIEIIFSNHGSEFLIPFEKGKELVAPTIKVPKADLDKGKKSQTRSMDNMKTLIDRDVITKGKVDTLVQGSYIPNLKLISYSLYDNEQNITIFSHAGIGLQTIRQLAEKFRVEYNDATAKLLADTIEEINNRFAGYVARKEIGALISPVPTSSMDDVNEEPVRFTIWNRNYRGLNRSTEYNGYKMCFVHGHDSKDPDDHVFNLNNRYFHNNNIGIYDILESRSQGAPVKEPINFLSSTHISTIYRYIKNERIDVTEKIEFKKNLLTYQLNNLRKVTKWQEKLLPSGVSSTKSMLPPNEEVAKQILQGIQYIILDTNWDIGILGGERVRNTETGRGNTIPRGMYEILEEIELAKADQKWTDASNRVMGIMNNALKRTHGTLNQRGKTTEHFYKETLETLRKDEKGPPPSTPTISS